MFELKKVLFPKKYIDLAINKLLEQFGIAWKPVDNNIFRVVWYSEASKPYLLILNHYNQNSFVRKEWYEYYSNQWNFVGYLTREQCLQLYWEIKEADSLQWYGEYVRNDHDNNQVEKACRFFLDEHITSYRSFKLNK